MHPSERTAQRGFTYVWFLVAVAMMGTVAMVALDGYSLQRQREREDRLRWVGHEYRRALTSYYNAAAPHRYPHSLDELLLDSRFPNVRRHLRELYPDPMTDRNDWGLIVIDDAVTGLYSTAPGVPLKQAGFEPATEAGFDKATRYADWKF